MTQKELAKFDALRIEMDELDKRRIRQIEELRATVRRRKDENELLVKERDDLLMHKASRDSQIACLLRELCPDIKPYPSMNEARDRIKRAEQAEASLLVLREQVDKARKALEEYAEHVEWRMWDGNVVAADMRDLSSTLQPNPSEKATSKS